MDLLYSIQSYALILEEAPYRTCGGTKQSQLSDTADRSRRDVLGSPGILWWTIIQGSAEDSGLGNNLF